MSRGGRPPRVRQPSPESLLRPQTKWATDSLRATMYGYLEGMAVLQRSQGTRRTSSYSLLTFARWCEERALSTPGSVTSEVLERYQRHLFYVRKQDGQPLSAISQHHALTVLRQYFKWCTRHRVIPANPASELELPRLGHHLPRHCLTLVEVELVLQQPRISTVTGLRDRAVMEFSKSQVARV